MKTLRILLLLAAAAGTALAGPFQKDRIAADARWVIHLDLQGLLGTQLGQTLAREAVDRHMTKPAADLKKQLDFDFDWRRIRSVSLYGSDFAGPEKLRGVLLIDSDMDLARGLQSAFDRQEQLGMKGQLRREAAGASTLYSFKDDLFVGTRPGGLLVVSQLRETASKAREVLEGKAPNLNSAPGFGDFCQVKEGFFFLAAAQGFSESAPVPPQAKVLKMADGLRLSLGEKAGNLVAHLTLSAKTAESASQMHLVLQGMLALFSLSQSENRELQTLLQATRVSINEKLVAVEIELPVAAVCDKIAEETRSKAE